MFIHSDWSTAVASTGAFLVAMINYIKTLHIERRGKSNEVKLDHNNRVTENTNEQLKAVGIAINGRMELLLKTYADLAIVQAKLDGTLSMDQIQIQQAERILIRNKIKIHNAAKLAENFGKATRNFLIVEDSIQDAELFSIVLSSVNCNSFVAKNNKEMIKLLAEHIFDAVFVDLNLPGSLSGYELIKIITMAFPELPVFVVTGIEDEKISAAIRMLGAISIAKKPVNESKLRELFNNSLKQDI